MAFVTTTAILFGKGLVSTSASKLASSLLSAGNKKAASIFAKLKVDSIAGNYSDKVVSRVITFKTLNGDGQDTTLNDIYVPLSIRHKLSNHVVSITEGTTLKSDSCICITGRAGQGKTTIMRKLFIEEFIFGERFPFFITLRDCDFEKNNTCVELLLEHLTSLGVDCKPIEVKALLESGRVILFFDGFDEVSIPKRLKALKLITDSHYMYSCPSITTARPDTEISKATKIDNYYVESLEFKTVELMINKIVPDSVFAKNIIDTISKNFFLTETINTPILISIFILTYLSFTDEPKAITDFYGVLFLSLIYKHDKNKNFIRHKKTTLSNNKLEYCFSIFSYLGFIKGDNTFSELSLRKYFQEATSFITDEDISELIMDDIVDGTNIVVMDGYDRFVYLHRSIQEFFTAKCIESFDEETKRAFYEQLLHDVDKTRYFEHVLKMLSTIDDKNFARFYILPKLKSESLLNDLGYVKEFEGQDFRGVIQESKMCLSRNGENYAVGMMTQSGMSSPEGIDSLEDICSIIAYGLGDHQTALMSVLGEDVQRLIRNFLKNTGLTLDEFNRKYVLDFSSDAPEDIRPVNSRIIDDGEYNVVLYGDGDDFLMEIGNKLAIKVNEMFCVINKYLDDNVYKYNQSNLLMINMLKK